jgi:fructose-bisphosphate aldolase, class I
MSTTELFKTIDSIKQAGKGILAADESTPTIQKRFAAIGVESTEDNRRSYRELLFTAPEIEKYISGVILFEETLYQKTKDGVAFPKILSDRGIIPGIKVDKGTIDLMSSPGDKITEGLDGLALCLAEYKKQGARFAKWRAVLTLNAENPRRLGIKLNATFLARYASICQEQGIVPIVEPELLMDGDHTIERCAEASLQVFHAVMHSLYKQKVILEGIILKPSMVISGKKCPQQAAITEVAAATLKILGETIPAAVPTINFLSGGQNEQTATAHLNAINQSKIIKPWNLSFSYGRALQETCMKTWSGKTENIKMAQDALLKRAKLNSEACLGKYVKE